MHTHTQKKKHQTSYKMIQREPMLVHWETFDHLQSCILNVFSVNSDQRRTCLNSAALSCFQALTALSANLCQNIFKDQPEWFAFFADFDSKRRKISFLCTSH